MTTSIKDGCGDRLVALARIAGLGARSSEILDLFATMTSPWGDSPCDELPESDVSPDGSPVEFALSMDGTEPACQVAVEPLPDRGPDGFAARKAAIEQTVDRIAASQHIDLDRWRAIANLFLPASGGHGSAAMIGMEIRDTGAPLWKVWLYPGVTGPGMAPERVREGLRCLGLDAAWPVLRSHARRGFSLDPPILFSIDLTPRCERAVKVYFRHYEQDPAGLARQLRQHRGFDRPIVETLGQALTGGAATFESQAPVTCVAFGRGSPGVARDVTAYFPLWTYEEDDRRVSDVVSRLLTAEGHSPDRYRTATAEVARRPLDGRIGLHNYLSWQPKGCRSRFKVYLSPELRSTNPVPRYGRPAGVGHRSDRRSLLARCFGARFAGRQCASSRGRVTVE